jgi:23S rRNA A1618 N6-methylase RlmF
MNAKLINGQTKLSINVLVKNEKDGRVSARVLGLPEYSVTSSDRKSAISELDRLITANLSENEVVSLELEIPKREHPWQKFAGIYKNSQLFDSVLTNIDFHRHKLDSQTNSKLNN